MLTGNKIKIIACIAMLIDHIGLFLFPDSIVLRCIGRIAMPLFAFFIAEGCRYTSKRLRYFLNVFVLALICQSVYLIEMFINGGAATVYLNILFTFSLSILLCFAYFDLRDAMLDGAAPRVAFTGAVFALTLIFVIAICLIAENAFPVEMRVEYGITGVLLPLFAALFENRHLRILCFAFGCCIFSFVMSLDANIAPFAMLAIPILILYNGKRGSKRLKYAFYLFYPPNIGGLYLIKLLFF